jgi:bacillithiol biosynthesis cysteine-adding enzyme BshC
MIKATVDPACTGQFSQLFLDYIQEKPELKDFYSQYPRLENFSDLIKAKKFTAEKRETLLQSLKSQYQGIAISDDFEAQIVSLGKENTFTVTTGHQLNLFTGPLYFIYKIVSTINLAKELGRKYPQHHFVPVYWMATEDHDFDEINYFKLDGKKYQWNSDQRGAVGDFELDKTFVEFMKSVSFVPDFFKEAYSDSKTLAEAVRKYVHHLFGDKGLVVIDGNDALLKKSLIPVIAQDILTGVANQKAQDQTKKVEALGYKSQIFPREINFFYMDKGLRERIEKRNKTFYVLDTELKFEEEEIKTLIHNNPEKFSPNVVLRPLYQEMILPNIAYLGGPAEVVYWLQLKTIFDHFGEVFPALLPRNFALVLDALTVKKMNSLNLSNEDLFADFVDWKKRFVAGKSSLDIFLKTEKEKLSRIFEESGSEAAKVDQSLQNAYEAARVRVDKILDHLSIKVRKAEERRLKIEIGRMDAIKAYINPNGNPQEREENFMKFYLKNPDFIAELLSLFDPFDFNFMILKP